MGEDGWNFCDLTTGLLCVLANAAGPRAKEEGAGRDGRARVVQRRVCGGQLLLTLWVFVVIVSLGIRPC